jgi:transcriptional regulator with XRE-family HTH domain
MPPHARQVSEVARELGEFLQNHPGSQQKLADKAGVSQSTISRVKNLHKRKRVSRGLQVLCKYAGILVTVSPTASIADPATSAELMGSLREVWDGTEETAKELARVIRSLKPFVGRKK